MLVTVFMVTVFNYYQVTVFNYEDELKDGGACVERNNKPENVTDICETESE